MEGSINSIDVAIEGMRESLRCLESPTLSQAEAFTHFSHFVMRSAQARNQFIRAYRSRTGRKAGKRWAAEMWRAPVGDSNVSLLFHQLRTDDFHAQPFVVTTEEQFTCPIAVGDNQLPGFKVGPYRAEATLAAALFGQGDGPGVVVRNQFGQQVQVTDFQRKFVLERLTPASCKLIADIGEPDIVVLARRQMTSVDQYRSWFDMEFPAPQGSAGHS